MILVVRSLQMSGNLATQEQTMAMHVTSHRFFGIRGNAEELFKNVALSLLDRRVAGGSLSRLHFD